MHLSKTLAPNSGVALSNVSTAQLRETFLKNALLSEARSGKGWWQRLRGFTERLFVLGITPNVPFREAKLMRFTNMLSVLVVLGIVLYIPYSVITGSYMLAAIEFVDAMMVASALWFAHKGRFNASKFILIGVVNVFIYINACYIGHNANIQHFYVLINIVPFLVFRLNQYREILASMAMTIGSFLVYQLTYSYWVPYNLPADVQSGTNTIGMWLDFVLFAVGIYLLAKNNFDIEEQLAESYTTLQVQAAELKRSNEDLEQFGYIVSHDLRVPLRNIISFMGLLEKRHQQDLSTDGKEFIQHSVNGAKRMERLIEDMLAYSKMGRNLPAPQAVDVNEVLNIICFEMREKTQAAGQRITIAGKMPVVPNVHSSMVYHVLQNLITNGLKFNKTAQPEVTVAVSEQELHYVFSVTDNGIGIPAEHKNKLFQMFRRLHTEAEFQGTGIGLAICKKIVNFYNGEIWLESEPGNGTTFYFTLLK